MLYQVFGKLDRKHIAHYFCTAKLHGQKIGSYIIDTLESDGLFLRAKRIEIPASITAVEFYRKKGYDYKMD